MSEPKGRGGAWVEASPVGPVVPPLGPTPLAGPVILYLHGAFIADSLNDADPVTQARSHP